MAIIYSYPTLANLSAEDLLLVSDVSSVGKQTKNITVQQIVDLFPNIVPGGGTLTSVTLDFGTTGLLSSGAVSQTINTGVPGTFSVSGTLGQGFGGTGLNTYAAGDILYANNSNVLTVLPRGTTGQVLQLTGAAGSELPAWGSAGGVGTVTSVGLATTMSGLSWTVAAGQTNPTTSAATFTLGGTLGIANGGTGATTQSAALDAITNASSGTAGQILTTDGSNASWSTFSTGVSSIDFGSTGLTPSTTPGTGAVVVGGTLVANSGGTGISSALTIGGMLYASSATAYNLLPVGTTGQILNVAAGVPTWTNPVTYNVTADTTVGLSSSVILNDSAGGSTRVDLVSNDTSVTNTDLNIKGSSTTGDINIFHKDLLGSAAAGVYQGIEEITFNTSGHATAVTAKVFTPSGKGQSIVGRETAGSETQSAAEQIIFTFIPDIKGSPQGIQFEATSTTQTPSDTVAIGIYDGNLTAGSGNLVAGSTAKVGNSDAASGGVLTAGDRQGFAVCNLTGGTAVAPTLVAGKEYIMIISIESPIQLLAVENPGTLLRTGGRISSAWTHNTWPANLAGVTWAKTTPTFGGYTLPSSNWADPVTS